MRKVSFGLGLAGGILAVCNGIVKLFSSLFHRAFKLPLFGTDNGLPRLLDKPDTLLGGFFDKFISYLLPGSIILIAAGILGIIGACLIKKNSKTAGILMLIAAGICVVGYFNSVIAGLLIAAGVLALIKQESKTQPKIEE